MDPQDKDELAACLYWVAENGTDVHLALLRRLGKPMIFDEADIRPIAFWADKRCEERSKLSNEAIDRARSLVKVLLEEDASLWVRLSAARELSSLGQWTRDDLATRGSMTRAGVNRLPDPFNHMDLLGIAERAPDELRCQVLMVIGEWCGAEAVEGLRRILVKAETEEIREHAILALQTIGGPASVEILRQLAGSTRESEPDRKAALRALLQLATGGRMGYTEGLPAPSRELSPEVPALVETLDLIRKNPKTLSLRRLAEDLLAYVGPADTRVEGGVR